MTKSSTQGDGFHHEAFFYAGRDEFLAGTVPFVEEGVAAGEAVLVAVPEPNRQLLRDALGAAAEGVQFVVMEELGRNPGRIISAWREFLRESESDGARGIGEPIWAGRSPTEIDECQRHERLLNVAFDGGPSWTLMCPYNASALGDEVLGAAAHCHPHCSGEHDGASAQADPSPLLEGALPEPEGPSSGMLFGPADLRAARRLVAGRAGAAGLDLRRIEDLVLAVCEVATNSIQHGGGEGSLRVWSEGDAFVCDIRDTGHIKDPLVGRERPTAEQARGRGLWIANQVCDLVQIRSGEEGTHIRLRMQIP